MGQFDENYRVAFEGTWFQQRGFGGLITNTNLTGLIQKRRRFLLESPSNQLGLFAFSSGKVEGDPSMNRHTRLRSLFMPSESKG